MTVGASTTGVSRRRTIAGVAAVFVIAAYALHAWSFREQINDDAFITFRYSKFLSLGRGPYYNAGEHVEGYTNFLLMMLLAGVHRLAGDGAMLPAAKLIGVASGCVAIWGAAQLSAGFIRSRFAPVPCASTHDPHESTIDPPQSSFALNAAMLGWLSAGLVAVSSAFAVNSTTGLETTLFSALIVCGLWATSAANDLKRWRGAGVFFALACLTRPEGTLVFAAAVAGQLPGLYVAWRGNVADDSGQCGMARAGGILRRLALDIVIVAIAVGGLLAFRYVSYDGELVPNTYFAKQGGVVKLTAMGYLADHVRYHLAIVPWLLALVPVAIGGGKVMRRALPAAFVMLASIAAIFAAGADWMLGSRLFVPYLPVVAALAGTGIALLVTRFFAGVGLARNVQVAGACIALVIGVLFVWEGRIRGIYHDWVTTRAIGYREGHTALADWLNETARPGQTVALMDIGIVGFRCIDLHVLDVSGLTDRTIAKSPGPFLNKDYDTGYVFGRKPEYIVLVLHFRFDERGVPDVANPIPWTLMEKKLMGTPEFRVHYARPRPDPRGGKDLDRLAAVLGAERVFEHRVPAGNYMLCAYRYRE